MDRLPESFIKSIASEYGISLKELDVLSRALQGVNTQDIASTLNVKDELVRKRLSDVYRKLKVPGRGPVKLQKLRETLVKLYQSQHAVSIISKGTSIYGRQEELSCLKHWILTDHYRLVSIVGIKGIGKTELARQLYTDPEIHQQFDYVLWESLRYRPHISDVINRILQKLNLEITSQPGSEVGSELTGERELEYLVRFCNTHACFLIIDQMDAIIEDQQFVGTYRKSHEPYSCLIRDFSHDNHQSCLLLTSRYQFPEIAALEGTDSPSKTLDLKGLSINDARQLLKSCHLVDEDKWPILVQQYGGHPEQLKFVSSYIREVFNGSVAAFLAYNQDWVIRDIACLLEQQLQCLSTLERQIIEIIAQAPLPLSLEQTSASLQTLVTNNKSLNLTEVWAAVQSLKRRALITLADDQSGFILQHQIIASYIGEQRSG